MKSITYSQTNIKRWMSRVANVQQRGFLELVCILCAFQGLFEFLETKKRNIYDLDYSAFDPKNLKTMSIKSDILPILFMKCPKCGAQFHILPSFIIQGTTLTLRAILFVAMMYESGSDLTSKNWTWRGLADQIGGAEAIDHSVLYRAVHALGKTIESSEEMQYLMGLYPEIFPQTEEVEQAWPAEKAVKKNTKKRELGVRRILTNVWQRVSKDISLFNGLLNKLQEKIADIFKEFSITLATLYPIAHNA